MTAQPALMLVQGEETHKRGALEKYSFISGEEITKSIRKIDLYFS